MSAGICITYCGHCVQQHKAEERTRGFKVDITPLVRLASYRTVFLKKLGSGKHIDPKFGRREGCVSYYWCQDKKVPERRSVFVLLRKNFRNGVPSQKYPWLYIDLLWRFVVHVDRVRLFLRTAASNGPDVHTPEDIWVLRATVERYWRRKQRNS
jgi:hypothetical protein